MQHGRRMNEKRRSEAEKRAAAPVTIQHDDGSTAELTGWGLPF